MAVLALPLTLFFGACFFGLLYGLYIHGAGQPPQSTRALGALDVASLLGLLFMTELAGCTLAVCVLSLLWAVATPGWVGVLLEWSAAKWRVMVALYLLFFALVSSLMLLGIL